MCMGERGRRLFGAGRTPEKCDGGVTAIQWFITHSFITLPLGRLVQVLKVARGRSDELPMPVVHDWALPTADDIVRQHAELLQVVADCRARNKGGRPNKHDQARLRFIKDIALRGLRFGKLVPQADLNMIRLAPKEQLRANDLAVMDAWAKRHAPDPRSSNQGASAELSEKEQTTLLRWAAAHAADFVAPMEARRGAPAAYVLHFGAYKGFRLRQLARASLPGGGGRSKLLPHASSSTPAPGDYLLWLAASAEFEWHFPYHVYLYLALLELESDGVFVVTAAGQHAAVSVSAAARMRYGEYAQSLMTPFEGEADPYVNGGGGHDRHGGDDDGDSDDDDDDDAGSGGGGGEGRGGGRRGSGGSGGSGGSSGSSGSGHARSGSASAQPRQTYPRAPPKPPSPPMLHMSHVPTPPAPSCGRGTSSTGCWRTRRLWRVATRQASHARRASSLASGGCRSSRHVSRARREREHCSRRTASRI